MLFPKGPRFLPEKISDVPGPGTYDLDQETQPEYKHGAFLEKTDRFSKDKPSDVPGPSSATSSKPTRPTFSAGKSTNSLATLQRKLDDLTQIHADSKRTYQSEIDRLKLELNKAQRTIADQSTTLDKQRKHADASDARILEFKKDAVGCQAEIKDLKFKLRVAEGDKGKQAEFRKALDASEARRRDAEKKLLELEKTLASERKKRELAEERLLEVKSTIGEEITQTRTLQHNLQSQVDARQAALDEAADTEEELVEQLNRHRDMLTLAAREYGKLAAETVPAAAEARLKRDVAAMQVQALRMNRKLANSEAQVMELAHLIRHTKDENKLLSGCLKDVEEEAASYARALADPKARSDEGWSYDTTVGDEITAAKLQLSELNSREHQLSSEFHRLSCAELVLLYSIVDHALSHEQSLAREHTATNGSLTAEIQSMKVESESIRASMVEITVALSEAKAAVAETHSKMVVTEKQTALVEEKLDAEKRTVQRLNTSCQRSKMAEESLRAEINQLTLELTEAEQYQDAYIQLSEELGSLIARNALAEDEAEKLSKFNAEILGHKNPDQRIMYVDRIRRELAETKHKLVMSARDHAAAVASNEDLRHELDMYTSVMVQQDHKPRTNLTRVGRAQSESTVARPPLASQNVNVERTSELLSGIPEKPSMVIDVGDMTLEELS